MFIRQQQRAPVLFSSLLSLSLSLLSAPLSLFVPPLLGIRKFHEQLLHFNFISISPLLLAGNPSAPCSTTLPTPLLPHLALFIVQ